MFRQAVVDHHEIAFDEIGDAHVFAQQLVKEGLGLRNHRKLQELIELWVKLLVRRGGLNVAQFQPLAHEVLGESRRLGVLQESLRLRLQPCRLGQLLCGSGLEQLLIRHGTPQEI